VIQKYDIQDLQVVGLAVPTTNEEAYIDLNSGVNSGGPTWLIFILVVLFFVAVSLLQFYYMYACIKTEKESKVINI